MSYKSAERTFLTRQYRYRRTMTESLGWVAVKPVRMQVTSLVDSVESALRQQILDQEIAPGSRVKETDVAAAFGVARPSAKAAIERLIAQGLLRRDIHRSARVPVLEPAEIADLYFSRGLLEEQVVAELALRKERIGELDRHVALMRSLPADTPPNGYVDPDINFHLSLSGALGSPRVSQVHAGLLQETRLCMAQVQHLGLLKPDLIIEEHELIARTIREGEPDEARTAMRAHLRRAQEALLGHLASGEMGE
jgi:DNA-binding GntR family transcriptional regulator